MKGYLVAHPTASKWVITTVINGISRVNPLITGVITHLLSGMSHQVWRGTWPQLVRPWCSFVNAQFFLRCRPPRRFFRQEGMSALHLPFLKGHFLRGYGDTLISYEFHFQKPRILMKKQGTLDRATGSNAYRLSNATPWSGGLGDLPRSNNHGISHLQYHSSIISIFKVSYPSIQYYICICPRTLFKPKSLV